MSKATNNGGQAAARPNKAHDQAERRDATAPRTSYEALVDVGGQTGGFEAESVDVSLDGIRLRTAYMPEMGERMVFRFDGVGGEVVAEGDVVWCQPARRGGEFGVRFTSLEPRAARMLYSMCEQPPALAEEAAASEPEAVHSAQPGDRVRLHIKGLGSPMRARVRDVARGEVLVGSTLEFLRVGRDLELESVEEGQSRVAHIEHVGVEIDPETNVPQLVVALSYDRPSDAPQELGDQLATSPFRVGRAAAAADPEPEITPEPQVIDTSLEPPPARPVSTRAASTRAPSARAKAAAARAAAASEAQRGEHDDLDSFDDSPITVPTSLSPEAQAVHSDDDDDFPQAPAPGARMAELAGKLKPGLAAAGAGAKGMLDRVLAVVRDKRAAKDVARRDAARKRTTAPPPSGALRSDGKRLFRVQGGGPPRGEAAPSESVPPPAPASDKKRAVFGAVLGVLAVMAIYFASNQLRSDAAADKDPSRAAADPALAAQIDPAQAAAAAAGDVPGAPDGAMPTANVPLFGATPMSTTEPVPMPPDPNAEPGADGEPGDDAAPAEGAGDANAALKLEKEWGVGEVHNPTVLRLRMNGQLEGLHGSETATGFTLVIPGHKSVSSAAGLARKDKRIEAVDVVNYPDRAEITVRFRGEIPPFVAKTKGKRLIIEISSAKKSGGSKKAGSKKASGKKAGSKKAGSKKAGGKKASNKK